VFLGHSTKCICPDSRIVSIVPYTIPLNEKFSLCRLIFYIILFLSLLHSYVTADAGSDSVYKAPVSLPNVVVVVVDALRGDMLSAKRNGISVMPNLAALSCEGRMFTAANSPCSWTRPSMASLFTGQHVDIHKVYYGSAPNGTETSYASVLSCEWTTLAEALRDAGFTNFGFVTNPNVAPGSGIDQGFTPENYGYELNIPAEQVTAKALERTATLPQPFFMYLHYMEPHVPYDPPPEYLEIFGDIPPLSNSDCTALLPDNQINYLLDQVHRSFEPHFVPKFEQLSKNGELAMRLRYEGECRYADEQILHLVHTIRTKFPNTIFIITSDHGEQFWEHGGMGHGMNLYDECIHVPLIFYGLGIAPAIIHEPVSTLGLFKTLANLLGLHLEFSPLGLDLLCSIPMRHPVFSRTRGPEPGLPIDLQSVRLGAYKLIVNRLDGTQALYDIREDPREHEDVKDTQCKVQNELTEILRQHDAAMKVVAGPEQDVSAQHTEPEFRDQLDALGYVGIMRDQAPK
jgi:arylsulfatase A-like enzyme